MIEDNNFYLQFKKALKLDYLKRELNKIEDKWLRKDLLFHFLARLYLDNKKEFKRLGILCCKYLKNKKNPDELDFAVAAYFAYIKEDFKSSKKFLIKAINLSPENLDNWLDLGFVLRHLGKEELSNGFFFNYDLIIHYWHRLNFKNVDFNLIKKLILEVKRKINS